MKKIIIAVLVIAVAGVGFILLSGKDQKGSESNTSAPATTETNKTSGKKACELLTLEDAKALIGDSAVLADGSGSPNLATTEDVNVDNCTYSADGATLGDLKQISVQRHHGNKSQIDQAYENYKKEFPGEDLTGLGDKAYYVSGAEQVQVVKDDYWLYVAGGSINAGNAGNRELVTKAAQLALAKL